MTIVYLGKKIVKVKPGVRIRFFKWHHPKRSKGQKSFKKVSRLYATQRYIIS